MRFSRQEMEEFVSLVGDTNRTIHTHHCKQGEGNDRCYVTKKDDVVLAFCHHCGVKGAVPVKRAAYKRYKKSAGAPGGRILSSNMPADLNTKPNTWPVEALKWPLTARLSFSDMEGAGMGYSERLGRVVVPVINGGYAGYVARRVGTDGPKYLSATNDKSRFTYHIKVNSSAECIVVEDILSAIVLSKSGYNVIALLGTSVTEAVKLCIIEQGYKKFTLWLDNDNAQVKLNQATAKRDLELYGKVRLVKTTDDPKMFTQDEIHDILLA